MRPGLLLVRTPYHVQIGTNAEVRGNYRIVYLGTSRPATDDGTDEIHISPVTHDSAEIEGIVDRVVRASGIEFALVTTPYSEYGEKAARALKNKKVRFLWTEVFPGTKLCLDRFGCQYTHQNEIDVYEGTISPLEPELPIPTRLKQPSPKRPEDLHAAYGAEAIPVFGQVPFDNSLKRPADRLSYYDWLDGLFRGNPSTKFLFKHHPASAANSMAKTEGIDQYPNVTVIDESVESLFEAYKGFAAYNSTVILEGVSRGLPFVTGGRHYLDSRKMVVQAHRRDALEGVAGRLPHFIPEADALRHRLTFLTRYYAIDPRAPLMLDRITKESRAFFSSPR